MVGNLVPLKGGMGSIESSNWQEKCHLYTTYSPCLRLGGYIIPIPPFTFEPEKSTDHSSNRPFPAAGSDTHRELEEHS